MNIALYLVLERSCFFLLPGKHLLHSQGTVLLLEFLCPQVLRLLYMDRTFKFCRYLEQKTLNSLSHFFFLFFFFRDLVLLCCSGCSWSPGFRWSSASASLVAGTISMHHHAWFLPFVLFQYSQFIRISSLIAVLNLWEATLQIASKTGNHGEEIVKYFCFCRDSWTHAHGPLE